MSAPFDHPCGHRFLWPWSWSCASDDCSAMQIVAVTTQAQPAGIFFVLYASPTTTEPNEVAWAAPGGVGFFKYIPVPHNHVVASRAPQQGPMRNLRPPSLPWPFSLLRARSVIVHALFLRPVRAATYPLLCGSRHAPCCCCCCCANCGGRPRARRAPQAFCSALAPRPRTLALAAHRPFRKDQPPARRTVPVALAPGSCGHCGGDFLGSRRGTAGARLLTPVWQVVIRVVSFVAACGGEAVRIQVQFGLEGLSQQPQLALSYGPLGAPGLVLQQDDGRVKRRHPTRQVITSHW